MGGTFIAYDKVLVLLKKIKSPVADMVRRNIAELKKMD